MDNNEFAPDLVTLVDDEENEYNFEILDILEYEDSTYYALYPMFKDPQSAVEDSGEYYVMEEITDESGVQQLAEVEDDELADKLAEMFEERFEEIFSEEDEE